MKGILHRLALWTFFITFARPVLWWLIGVNYRRRHNVPKGPCLIVANHNSHLDTSILLSLFPLRRLPDVHPAAAADYWQNSLIKKLFAMVFMNALPIDRRPEKGKDPLLPLIDALDAGKSLIFFPEGSRGEAGVVAPFRAGVGKLVQRLPGLLVLPVFLSGPERIWPRGEVVPVPLGVDVRVGRPRTYDAELSAREIADRVRDDLLALAPPPPPPPAAAPQPPLRIAVCGIDETDRQAVYGELVRQLGATGRTVGLANPVVEADEGGVREIVDPVPFTRVRPWLGPLAWFFRTSGLYRGPRFGERVERALLDEALTRSQSRYLVTEGSAAIDLLAWTDAQRRLETNEAEFVRNVEYLAGERRLAWRATWSALTHTPEIWLFHTFNLARPPVPDVLIQVRTSTDVAMERRRAGGAALEAHEHPDTLAELRQAYDRVGDALARRRRVEVIAVDPETDDLVPLVGKLASALAERHSAATGEAGPDPEADPGAGDGASTPPGPSSPDPQAQGDAS